MSTSVKMSNEGKRRLDKLQAKLVIATGRKISQQELLDAVVTLSAELEDELFGLIAGVDLPLSTEDLEKLMAMPREWGVETREEEIDLHLYGKDHSKQAECNSP